MFRHNHNDDDETPASVLKQFADEEYEPQVQLKSCINVADLLDQNGGAMFEVNSDASSIDESHLPTYQSENVYKESLNMEALGMNDDESSDETPFEKLSKTMTDLTQDGGVKKKVLVEGFGDKVPLDMEVTIHYSMHLEYSDEPFDSTRLRDKPFRYVLGCGEMIEGLELAIATMKRKEECLVLIKPKYAFKQRGVPPRIPAKATLLVRVELLSWLEAGDLHKYFQMPREDRRCCDFKVVKKVASSFSEEGNEKFNQDRYTHAVRIYTKGIRAIEDYRPADEEVEKEFHRLLIRLYVNNSNANLRLNNLGGAKFNADKALQIDPNSIKALYFMGKAQRRSGDFDQAVKTLKKAQSLEPKNRHISEELQTVNRQKKLMELDYVDTCRRMFGNQPKKGDKSSSKTKDDEYSEAQLTEKSKQHMQNILQSFLDQDIMELALNCTSMTKTERDYVKSICADHHVEYKEKGEGSNLHIRLAKLRL